MIFADREITVSFVSILVSIPRFFTFLLMSLVAVLRSRWIWGLLLLSYIYIFCLWKFSMSWYLSTLSFSFLSIRVSLWDGEVNRIVIIFLVEENYIWSSGFQFPFKYQFQHFLDQDCAISLLLCIPNFLLIISTFISFLGHFVAFTDDVIYSFIDVAAYSAFTVLLCFIDFGFDEVRPILASSSAARMSYCLSLKATIS